MKKRNNGFTLAELLVVVAIIAVLVAICIPVFAGQLEKSAEAVDMANVRNAYAEVMTAAISEDTGSPCHQEDGSYLIEVPLKQRKDGWTTKMDNIVIGGVAYTDDDHWLHDPEANGICKVYFRNGELFLDWGNIAKGSVISPTKQTHINNISAQDFLTKDKLTEILTTSYPHTIVNSNESVLQNEGTKKFLDYAKDHGFNLTEDYGAVTWQIYVKDPSTGQMLDNPAIYWSTIELTDSMVGHSVPVIGYRDGKYDVYRAMVVRHNADTDFQYNSLSTFASIKNGDGSKATFQFDSYEDAWAAYDNLRVAYERDKTVTDAALKDNNL